MDLEALQSAMVRVDTSKLYIFAEIVPSFPAEPAFLTRNARFHCHSVTCDHQSALSSTSFLSSFHLSSWCTARRKQYVRKRQDLPTTNSSTHSPTLSTMPEASCPKQQSPSTFKGPIAPVFQKCMSDLHITTHQLCSFVIYNLFFHLLCYSNQLTPKV